jgi:hypothetical protein
VHSAPSSEHLAWPGPQRKSEATRRGSPCIVCGHEACESAKWHTDTHFFVLPDRIRILILTVILWLWLWLWLWLSL